MSVRRPAFNFDGVLRLFGLSMAGAAHEPSEAANTFKWSAAYEEALLALGDREVEAVMVLQAHNAAVTYENAMRVGAYQLRCRTRKSRHDGTPLTSFRSAMRHASQADRKSVADLKKQLAKQFGDTRPVDPLSPLCAMLHERGMTPMEIAELLHRLAWASGQAVERTGASREGARDRIKKRIARARPPAVR
jgi:hypothetical protein